MGKAFRRTAAVPGRRAGVTSWNGGTVNSLRIFTSTIAALAAIFFRGHTILAGNATWLESPATGLWNDAANWSPAVIPNGPQDVATFGSTDLGSIIGPVVTLTANTEVSGIVFTASAPNYNIVSNNVALTISGAGVANNLGAVKTLIASGNNGVIRFQGNATAGDGNVGVLAQFGGTVFFAGSANGGAARIGATSNGVVDISGLTSPGMTAGYIVTDNTGSNFFRLGSKTLTVGGSNASTTVSGVIADGGAAGGVGGSIVKVGTGIMTYAGAAANTYTGPTFVNDGTLVLNKTVEAIRGPLVVGDGVGTAGSASVNSLGNPNNIQDGQPVTVNSDGQFSLGPSLVEFIGSLTVNQGLVAMAAGGRLRTTGPLTMTGGTLSGGENSTIALENGTVQATSVSDGTAAKIASQVQLTTAHTFVIGDGPGATDLLISGSVFSSSPASSIIKSGPGVMVLSGANSHARSTIAAGTLSISRDVNLGEPPNSPLFDNLIFDSGTLRATGSFAFNANRGITLNSGGGTIEVESNLEVHFPGVIAGTGNLTKTGSGTLIIEGAGPNEYTGITTIKDGTLTLTKGDGSIQSIAGPLVIGDGLGAAKSARVITFGDQLSGMVDVNIRPDGSLSFSASTRGIRNLTLDGGSAEIAYAGVFPTSLSVNGNFVMTGGSVVGSNPLILLGPATATSDSGGLPASITTVLSLGEATRNFTVNDGPGAIDLSISGAIISGGVAKNGAGTLLLAGPNFYTGPTTIIAGKLMLTGNISGSTTVIASGATLQGNGTAGQLTINSGGTLIPGLSAGTLNTGNLTLDPGSTSSFELAVANVAGAGVNDLVNITGNLTLDGTLVVTELPGFGEGVFPLFDYTGTLTNNGLDLEAGFLAAHPGSSIVIDAVNTRVNLAVVPEPGLFHLVFASGALLRLRRSRARK